VIAGGVIRLNDSVEILEAGIPAPDAPKVALVTLSDKGSRGEREDVSGRFLTWYMTRMGAEILFTSVIPDEKSVIRETLLKGIEADSNLILTTGGTGLAPRDVTPEVTRDIIDREVPGFAEAMRADSLKKTPHAMISRAVSGVAGKTLIINLPGSPKAVAECMETIFPALRHAIDKLRGDPTECAAEL
jgi:molybdenum cofactor synthesis domain-containing protein